MVLRSQKTADSCKPLLHPGRGLSKNKIARLDLKKCGVHRFCSDNPKTKGQPWLSFCFCNDISKFGPNQGRRRRAPPLLLFSGQGAQRLDGRGKLTEKSAMHFIPSLFAQAETLKSAPKDAQTGVSNPSAPAKKHGTAFTSGSGIAMRLAAEAFYKADNE